MREKLIADYEMIEDSAKDLWKGHGTDIGKINGVIYEVSTVILEVVEGFNEEDKLTTISYVRGALKDFEGACEKRDDFKLADCLYYEWRELVSIIMGE